MDLIEWSPKLETGIPAIDEQHKKLIGIINRLNDAMRVGKGKELLEKVFVELSNYTKYHFKTEEDAFAKYEYPHASEHKALHEDLISKLDELEEKRKRKQILLTVELMDFLKSWVNGHIMYEDRKYIPFLKGKEIM